MNRRALLAAVLAVPATATAQTLPPDERRQVLAERTLAAVLDEWKAGTASSRDVAEAAGELARTAAGAAFWTN